MTPHKLFLVTIFIEFHSFYEISKFDGTFFVIVLKPIKNINIMETITAIKSKMSALLAFTFSVFMSFYSFAQDNAGGVVTTENSTTTTTEWYANPVYIIGGAIVLIIIIALIARSGRRD